MFTFRVIRPGETAELKKLAKPNFSVIEQLFISKPKLGVVAEDEEGNIVGASFLVTVISGKEKIGCVDIIFVLPKYRGSGVGKSLYHAAVELLHKVGCGTIMALVRGDNSQSLRRFENEGLTPTSLGKLCRTIGFSAMAALFSKTASLSCATGCLILCDKTPVGSIGGTAMNLARQFLTNSIMLATGAALGSVLPFDSLPWHTMIAALILLCIMTFGEVIGRITVKDKWCFAMPQGGLIPSFIVALLGGFYPMTGHFYLKERRNTREYRSHIARPAIGSWILLQLSVFACAVFSEMHLIFSSVSDIGMMLVLFYALPFYPFDTFGGKRIREYSPTIYGALITFTLILILLIKTGTAAKLGGIIL